MLNHEIAECAETWNSVRGVDLDAWHCARPRSVSLDAEPMCTVGDWDSPFVIDEGSVVCVIKTKRRAIVMVRPDADIAVASAMLTAWVSSHPTLSTLDVVSFGNECTVAHAVSKGLARASHLVSRLLVNQRLFCLGPTSPMSVIPGVSVVVIIHALDSRAIGIQHTAQVVPVGESVRRPFRASCCGRDTATPPVSITAYTAALHRTTIVDI